MRPCQRLWPNPFSRPSHDPMESGLESYHSWISSVCSWVSLPLSTKESKSLWRPCHGPMESGLESYHSWISSACSWVSLPLSTMAASLLSMDSSIISCLACVKASCTVCSSRPRISATRETNPLMVEPSSESLSWAHTAPPPIPIASTASAAAAIKTFLLIRYLLSLVSGLPAIQPSLEGEY